MTDFDQLPFHYPDTDDRPATARPRPHRHRWSGYGDLEACASCGKPRDAAASRRGRNNRVRGGREELEVARLLGGRKVGPLGLPHDVEVPGVMRVQTKRLASWPSIAAVITWLDELQPHDDIRAVTVARAPGPGQRTRRLLIVDLEEYARWYGGRE